MKKIIILCNTVFFMSFFSINAQSSFGVKGGINYNSNGNLDEFVSETEQIIKDKGERKAGYSVGIYGKIDLGSLYIRPEVLYTKTTSEYALNSVNEEFNMRKISAPLLVGLELIGPLSVFAGPSFQYIMDNDFNGLDFDAIEKEFDDVNLKAIKLRAKNSKTKVKRQKVLGYWAIVRTLKLEQNMSFRDIATYFAKYHKLEVSYSTVYELWNELENNIQTKEN